MATNMSDEQLHITARVNRILASEEAIYGLILVSGMIVASASVSPSSWDAFIAVIVTVIVFFAAHVYAGTLGRLAATSGHSGVKASLAASAKHSSGMLLASIPPLVILALGASRFMDDTTALWVALIANTVLLGALGWVAVARWSTHWFPRILSAVITAAFGGVLIILKAVVSH